MARKKKNNISSMKILMAVIFINIAIYCIFSKTDLETFLGNISEVIDTNISETNALSNVTPIVDGNLNVHYIDVGQGDAILIENNGKFMLIDSGPSSAKDDLKKYLDEKGVKVLEYLVATHNHEDHIGSMTTVINNYTVNKLIMSKNIAITRVYENFVIAAKEKVTQVHAPVNNEEYELGEAKFYILADGTFETDEENNHSIIIKLVYGENVFLFTGDAEEDLELELVNNKIDLKADVLKIGHHGSYSSTSSIFLSKVNPDYAVLSLETNNSYGHPCKSVVERLNKNNIPLYRTDESGTIIATSDGKNITFNVAPGSYTYVSGKEEEYI